jgi:hypothetical protein
LLRLWGIVLACNLAGIVAFACGVAYLPLFDAPMSCAGTERDLIRKRMLPPTVAETGADFRVRFGRAPARGLRDTAYHLGCRSLP